MDREYMQEVINGMRKIVKPYLAKQLKKINFEGCGNTDKAEFETDFEIVLTLAEKALAIPSADKTDQWQELKETITEMRDNDGTGTQQDVCKFLVDYMEILEKQMQEPCEDAISRQAVFDLLEDTNNGWIINEVSQLPSVKPQTDCNTCDKAVRNRVGVIGCAKFDSKPTVAIPHDGEYISKSDMIDWLKDIRSRIKPQGTASEFEVAENQILNLIQMLQMGALPTVAIPSATGHWIAIENEEMETIGYYCSKCDLPMETEEQTDYCPNCGCRMVEPQERSDKE